MKRDRTGVLHRRPFQRPRWQLGCLAIMNREEYGQMYRLEDSHWWFTARRKLLVNALRQHLATHPQSDVHILDVGCGTGGTLDKLKPYGNVVGLDLEELALEFCRGRGWKTLVHASATALPFADGAFDAVVALDVLEHIPDHVTAASEIARVLAPGGIVLATVPAYRALWSRHDVALMHQRRYTAREVEELLVHAGLRVEYLTYTFLILFPIAVLVRFVQRVFQPNAAPRADVVKTNPFLNKLLAALLVFEGKLHLRNARLPFGLTVFAVARRPQNSARGYSR